MDSFLSLKISKKNIAILAVIGLVLFVAIELAVRVRGNIYAADATSRLLIEQIETIFDSNRSGEEALVGSLKDDYITRAKAISYTIEHDKELEGDIEGLKNLASLMSVDEIHLFDDKGVIYFGTETAYYGYSFQSGDQMAFFRPMLEDRSLSMCQDVTPNTAEGKAMMYALVWRQDNKGMVQVGINPERLMKEIGSHEVVRVIDSLPVIDGISIYIAESTSGTIIGSTNHKDMDNTLSRIGLKYDSSKMGKGTTVMLGEDFYRQIFKEYDEYVIGVLYNYDAINHGLLWEMTIVFCYILVVFALAFLVLRIVIRNRRQLQFEINKSHAERDKQLEVLSSMSEMYTSMYLINLNTSEFTEYKSSDAIREHFFDTDNIEEIMEYVMCQRSSDESREQIVDFCNLSTLKERMKGVKSMYQDFVNIEGKWSRSVFITIKEDDEGFPVSVIYAVQLVDEQKRREERLLISSNTDALTKCLNRRAYEHDIKDFEANGIPDDCVLVSIDVNGLKNVNDTLGHAAGDELILGATRCITSAMGSYGNIYRIGGDEFVAIIMVDDFKRAEIMRDLDRLTGSFTGKLVKSLAVSCGCVSYNEVGGRSISAMEKVADERMYAAKAEYYAQKGVDRRGQMAAYDALCSSYTKILKANFTDDTYSIIRIDEGEKEQSKGYDARISEWLYNFGASGQVHEDDLSYYLEKTNIEHIQDYFKHQKKTFTIFYRRLINDEYRNVMLEMVPAENYSDDNQVAYLFVKDIGY